MRGIFEEAGPLENTGSRLESNNNTKFVQISDTHGKKKPMLLYSVKVIEVNLRMFAIK